MTETGTTTQEDAAMKKAYTARRASARKIVEQRGRCNGVQCSDCPLNGKGQCSPIDAFHQARQWLMDNPPSENPRLGRASVLVSISDADGLTVHHGSDMENLLASKPAVLCTDEWEQLWALFDSMGLRLEI